MSKIRVGVIGVGNCFSSLIQGVSYYQQNQAEEVSGIMFEDIGGYKATDIEFVIAYDVDKSKVGLPLSEAVFAQPNCARVFHKDIIDGDVVVKMGRVLDGVSSYMQEQPRQYGFKVKYDIPEANMANVIHDLKESQVDVLLNYLPVGSKEATEFYAECVIAAGCSFVNCIPVLTLNHPTWEQKFIEAGIPYIGSDMKSQFGASILSQVLQELSFNRGMKVDFHQQINIGGNTDFNNMMVQSRLGHKKVSKENVIRAQNELRNIPLEDESLFAGPSTFIPYLKDNKVAYFNLRLKGFGGAEVELDCKLSVQDSENSAGVVIDAIRFVKVAKELGVMGCVRGPSAWTQKSPPKQLSYEDALKECQLLANRELSENTKKQLTKESATQFAWDEFNSGGMEYLSRVECDFE